MFNNIGGKIKGLAKFIFWVCAIIAVIGGMYTIITAFNSRSNSVIVGILTGLGIMIGGIILAWLENFLLYGFGELVDSNQKILRELERRNMPPVTTTIQQPIQQNNQ